MDSTTGRVVASTGFASLPNDILLLITDHLLLKEAKNLAAAHRALSLPARYRTLRHITINAKVADFAPARRWLRELKEGDWLLAVRRVTVLVHEYDYSRRRYGGNSDNHPDAEVQDRRHAAVCAALRAMPGLLQVDWRGSHIPDVVFDCLASMPQVRLSAHVHEHRQRQVRAVMEHGDGLLHRLWHNQNLYALDVEVWYIKVEECIAWMQALKAVLLSCAQLRKLRLDMAMPSGGCSVYTVPTKYHGLGFTGDEKLPALEELDIVAYPFGKPLHHWYDEKSTGGYPLDIPEGEHWAQNFDWSRLKRFSLNGDHAGYLAYAHMPALKELTVYDHNGGHSFLCNNHSPLELLDMRISRQFALDSLWRHAQHAKTLRRLIMRGDEGSEVRSGGGGARNHPGFCPLALQLLQLGQTFTLLEELRIDMNGVEGKWLWQSFDVLARVFTGLVKLELWFPLPSEEAWKEGKEPVLTFSVASTYFGYLREQGSGVTELVVHSGSPPPQTRQKALGTEEPSYAEENATTFRVALSEKDWDAAEGRFTTTCFDVCERGNEWMRAKEGQRSALQALAGSEFEDFCEGPEVAGLGRAAQRWLRVAWLGPVPEWEWEPEENDF